MSEMVAMFLGIALISAALTCWGVVLARREDRERRLSKVRKVKEQIMPDFDPDAHLGRCGTE
jgi:hypothetical protein